MDSSALETLEFYKIRHKLSEQATSILGKELTASLEPSSDYEVVQHQLEETAEAKAILESIPNVPLGGIRDIRELVRRAELESTLEPHELLAVGSTLYAVRRMKGFFQDIENQLPLLSGLANELVVIKILENSIENTVTEHGILRDDASMELYRLRREIKTAQQRVKEKLDSILHSSQYQKYFQDVLVTMRQDRYVIPIKQEYRNHFPGIVHDQSASGATAFIEPLAVVNLNNDIKSLMASEKNEIERILQTLTAQVASHAENLYGNCQLLAQLDFAFAKARLSMKMHAEKPILNHKGYVNLRQARHPLIDRTQVVPIDVTLGGAFNTLLITGPNTGGKTVTLKTVGLFALMTQAGLFILADSGAEMPVFQSVYADIGDEQSIEQSLSTFSAHMRNLVNILNRVSSNDLVLMDEIGAGTDPAEGSALAMAVLDSLHELGARTIVTTHYSELKTFAYTRQGMENASVEFDIVSLRPTYRLLIGVPGSSNAFAISRRLGLSAEIVQRAQEFVTQEHVNFEEVLSALEQQKKQYMASKEEAQLLQADLEKLKYDLREQQQYLTERTQQSIVKAKEEAAQILRQARRDAEHIIEELKAQFANQDVKQRQQAMTLARQALRGKISENVILHDNHNEGTPLRREDLHLGMIVYVCGLGQKGTVLSINDSEVSVQLGIMKMNVAISDCRFVEQKQEKVKTKRRVDFSKLHNVSRQIDVRGMTVEEAQEVLDKYLDDALLAALDSVLVIHGKGTGALRKGIRAYLTALPAVKEIHIAELNEGGDGATVVKFR